MAAKNDPGPGKLDFVNWSKREPKKATAKVWQMVQTFERSIGWRHFMAARGARAYMGSTGDAGNLFEGLEIDGPVVNRSGRRAARELSRFSGWGSPDREQHAKAMCRAANQKMFGLNQPKTQLVATDAEYEVRRQGVWADRFIEGTMHLSQGSYSDFWNLARQAAAIAWCSTGTVAVRTEPDFVAKRVRSRLRTTLNTFIDPADIGADKPLSYFDITWENPDYLCADSRWTPAQRDMIWKSATIPRHLRNGTLAGATFDTPMVKLCTAWRLPFGDPEKNGFKGRYALFVGGHDGKDSEPLHWEDWEYDEPSLSFYRVNRTLGDDFWGENALEIALAPLADAEDIDDKAQTTMKRTSQTILSIDGKGKVPDAFLRAKDVVIARYDSKKNENPVKVEKPGIMDQQYFNYRADKIKAAHDLFGLSMMHQAGEVQGSAGYRSGRSIRLEASLLPERFAWDLRQWQDWVAVECGKNIIRAARQVADVEPDWTVRWPGVNFEARVKVDVLDIDMEAYTIQGYAVSEQKNTPADRAEAAQEMYDRGEISSDQLDVILEGLLDTKKETKAATAERAYVAKTIDEILYGPPELVADENAYMAEEYIPPMPWYDADAMLAQAAPEFTQALIDRVPQNRRFLLRRFMEDIWALRQKQMRDVAMAEASVNVAAAPADLMGGGVVPQLPGEMPLGQPGLPASPPGTPGMGGPTPAAVLGAPAAAPAPGLPPALNAPGSPGLV